MKEPKRRNRKNNFFLAVLLLLIIKVLLAKIDIFGPNAIATGYFDVLIILTATCIISGLPTKGRLLAYSLFSFILGLIVVIFKMKATVASPLNMMTLVYFIDSIFVFSIFLLIRNVKSKRKEVVPKHPKSVYGIMVLFAALSIFNIVNAHTMESNSMDQAKKMGIFAYSILNPDLYINADSLPLTKKTPTGGSGTADKPAGGATDAIPTPTVDPNLPKYAGIAKGKNIIVIQWEALQDLAINRTLNGIEITPNLNQLLRESVYFKNGISQISMGTTSDAEFAVNTSLYPLPAESAFKTMADRDFTGLPELLKSGGYYTTTYHTNTATFWNRKNMYPALGFDKWYDSDYFGIDYKGTAYGSPDYILFKKGMDALKKLPQPFYAQFITVSSHSPFRIPSWMKTTDFGSNVNNLLVGKYFKTINYADRQLGMLIKDLKEANLYEDTLIILYGDHYGINEEKIEKYDNGNKGKNLAVLKDVLGRDFDALDPFNVPICFKLPGGIDPKVVTMPIGHIDILPTLLNMVSLENKTGKMFGHDAMNISENLLGVRFYAPSGSFLDNTKFYFGTEYAIDFATHTRTAVSVDPGKLEKVQTDKGNSDAYIRGLPKR